jgi:ethanolamine utilization protein EutQ (cupin superfamily)
MLKRLWNWLLGKTTIDEQIVEKVDNAKRTITAVKAKGKKVVEEIKDVVEAVQAPLFEGKVTKSKLRELKKSELQAHAKAEFKEEFDDSVTKSNLINKIYELHKEAK